MEPSPSKIQVPQPQVLMKVVSIDESWIVSSEMGMKQNLLICPVCYTIPIDNPVECAKCQRIFCRRDYDKIFMSQNPQEKRCPTCKLNPWRKKKNIHLSYKHLFDSLRFKCKVCQQSQQQRNESQMQNESMTKQELINHLEKAHNLVLSMDSLLYDFTFVSQQGIQHKLNWMQNLEINVKRNMGNEKFEIGGQSGRLYNINLKIMEANHPTYGSCKIKSTKSQTLKKNKQYIVWIVDLWENFSQQRYHDEEEENSGHQSVDQIDSYFNQSNHKYVFYSQQLQLQIEKNYQDFVKNIRHNLFCLDVRDYRYIINFSNKKQINTFTKSRNPILRVPIKL